MSVVVVILLAGLLVAGQATPTEIQQPENYELEINGESFDIGLGSAKEIVVRSGEKLQVKLSLKEIIEYADDFVRFRHKSGLAPGKSDLGEGISQVMMASPLGTMVMVQEYTTLNPTTLIDLMLSELTKEEVDYGYEYEETPTTRKVGDKELTGKRVTTSIPGEVWVREVLAYPGRDEGLLIVTMVSLDGDDEDELQILDVFWKSLKIQM